MENIIAQIKYLHEKSNSIEINLEEIREFTKYKYPIPPSCDANGDSIYEGIESKVDSRWEEGELDDLKGKSKSQTRSRQGSPRIKKYRMGSIIVQDSKASSKLVNSAQ